MTKGFTRIARIGKIGVIDPWEPDKPEPYIPTRGRAKKAMVVDDPRLRDIERLIGRERAEEAVEAMNMAGVEMMTLPEACTYSWLTKRNISFDYQCFVMGGRRELGGAIVDFIVYGHNGDGVACWRVQGTYWHSLSTRPRADTDQKNRLLRAWWRGNKITGVIDLWEGDIYKDYPDCFLQAEIGIPSKSDFFRRVS